MASSTATSPRVAYIIAELEDADPVFAPIKTASRVKVNWNSNAIFHVCLSMHLICYLIQCFVCKITNLKLTHSKCLFWYFLVSLASGQKGKGLKPSQS